MPEPVWYYARGDVERGPFTLPQIKALATASKLRPDDLVWKEGMENWTAAREVTELFPTAGLIGETAASNGSDVSGDPKPKATAVRNKSSLAFDGEIRGAVLRAARTLALLGTVLIVGARGCESLSERRVARVTANAELDALENIKTADTEKHAASRATLEHKASAFNRGVALYMGLAVLLAGAIGLMMIAESYERWLGVGVILIVIFATLDSFAGNG